MTVPFKATQSDGRYRHWTGKVPPVERPRNYQRRIGGPPLLFATDIRMTLLVTLALGGTMRPMTLWKTIGKKAPVVLDGLIESGLVVRWKLNWRHAYVALDPGHPAAAPFRHLLLAVADRYAFQRPEIGPTDLAGGEPAALQTRQYNSLNVFGDANHTLVLLVVFILGKASARDVVRGTTRTKKSAALARLWMFASHGILKGRLERDVRTLRCREHVFCFDDQQPLTPYIMAVLDVLDRYMPHLRVACEDQAGPDSPTAAAKTQSKATKSNEPALAVA